MKPQTIRKEVFLPHPPEDVWLALTDPQALAEWMMPNNFEPVVGRKFRFHVDPMPGPYPGGSECEVLEVDAPRRNAQRERSRTFTARWWMTAGCWSGRAT